MVLELGTLKDQKGSVALFISPFELTRLIEIPYVDNTGQIFFVHPDRPVISCSWFYSNNLYFDVFSRFLAYEMGDFSIQRGDNFRKPFDPSNRPLSLRQPHFGSVLMPK